MRVATLGALGDSYTAYERGFNPLRERAGYDPRFLPTYNPDMRYRGGFGGLRGDGTESASCNTALCWGGVFLLGGLAGYFAGKRWG